jgi:hypothetical protein
VVSQGKRQSFFCFCMDNPDRAGQAQQHLAIWVDKQHIAALVVLLHNAEFGQYVLGIARLGVGQPLGKARGEQGPLHELGTLVQELTVPGGDLRSLQLSGVGQLCLNSKAGRRAYECP